MVEFHKFGIAECLESGTRIYHEQVFDPTAIGRIIDLLSLELNLDRRLKWRFRASVELVMTECFFAQKVQNSPLSIECGMDSQGVCFGVSLWASDDLIKTLSTPKNLSSDLSDQGYPSSPWNPLSGICSRVWVKRKVSNSRIEIVFSHSLDSRQDEITDTHWTLHEIVQDPKEKDETFSPRNYEYMELGDLTRVERDVNIVVPDQRVVETAPDVVIKNVTDHMNEEAFWVRGQKDESVESTKIKSTKKSWFHRVFPFLNRGQPANDLKNDSMIERPSDYDAELKNDIELKNVDGVFDRIDKELPRIMKELESEDSKKLIQSLRYDLISQKEKIKEMMRKNAALIRSHDFHSSSRNHLHAEEMRRKDEQIFQKTHALSMAREHVNQLSMEIDRMKAARQKDASSEALYKRKLSQTVQMVQALKKENLEVLNELQSLKNEKSNSPSPASNDEGQAEKNALEHKLEDYKRINRQLLEKVNELESAKMQSVSVSKIDEMKARVAQAVQVAEKHKKEAEMLREQLKKAG